ncbi:hypothetical protein SLEP1_g18178 [Rubroshorea leprosula]|uniref:Uncharacterized protein n=1 Tax=Rubroshorea leprosula TaxID=152421 RepID=A0AAV5J093_9ROSI|nr:hypothetical protein SLEP1_g18178 [Rubroshorea leprosula]
MCSWNLLSKLASISDTLYLYMNTCGHLCLNLLSHFFSNLSKLRLRLLDLCRKNLGGRRGGLNHVILSPRDAMPC